MATRGFIGVLSIYKYCGSTAESNLDIAIGVHPAETGAHPALSDPVKMIGSIPLWAYRRFLMQPIHSQLDLAATQLKPRRSGSVTKIQNLILLFRCWSDQTSSQPGNLFLFRSRARNPDMLGGGSDRPDAVRLKASGHPRCRRRSSAQSGSTRLALYRGSATTPG
jgi:hypothetical protein